MKASGKDEVANQCVAKGWVKGGVTVKSLAKQLKWRVVRTWNLTKQHHDHLCEWTCLLVMCNTRSSFFIWYFYVLKFFSVAKTAPELTTNFYPSMWCYMDPEVASGPAKTVFERCQWIRSTSLRPSCPSVIFQGTKTISRQNYICTGGSTYASSLHNDNEIDNVHFAGIL